jgi:hypothetical protein
VLAAAEGTENKAIARILGADANTLGKWRWCFAKARFSLICEAVGDDEHAGCCEQRIDDVRQSVVAAIEALIGE